MVTGSMLLTRYFSEFWWHTPYWKRIVRFVVCAFAQMLLLWGFGDFQLGKIDSDDTTTTYIFSYVLPFIISGLLFTGLVPFVCTKLGLAQPFPADLEDYELSSLRINV